MELKVVDIAAISGLLSSIKASKDLTKAMLDIRDGQIGREQVIELTGQLVTAYDKALDARESQTKLHERIDELKDKLVKFENWDAEKARYQLTEVNTGVFAYAIKPGMEAGEPAHKICARCYEDRRRSILQTFLRRHGSTMLSILSCQTCKAEIVEGSKPIEVRSTRSRASSWRV